MISNTKQPSVALLSDAYLNGVWDGKQQNQPTETNWQSESYRKGYLEGIAAYYDSKYGVK